MHFTYPDIKHVWYQLTDSGVDEDEPVAQDIAELLQELDNRRQAVARA